MGSLEDKPITDNVNDDISLELLSPIRSELMNKSNSFSIIAVDMEHRTIISLSNICSIWRRASESRIRSKPNLIVHHNMNCAATTISLINLKTYVL